MQFTGSLVVLGAVALTLSACASNDDVYYDPSATAPAVTCDATTFDYLKGEPIESVGSIATPLRVRVLGPDDFVPKDYDPNRLTFTTSPTGTVSRIFCG
ncbi:MAG: hypothetical protein KDA73_01335 [Rhodobacteraceae bacterium]|nr:hypothetical protein [Paracoccaceae bacterium]